jgi:MFS family permease
VDSTDEFRSGSSARTLGPLTIAAFSYALGQTMTIPALPLIARDLHTTLAWATWVLTGFLLVSSVTTTPLGKVGDQIGKKKVLLACLGVAGLASAGAAASPDIASLIALRCLQGVGGAVLALSFAVIRDELPPHRTGPGIGLVSSMVGAGGAIGFLSSGLLLEVSSWRLIFVAGSAVTLGALALVAAFMGESSSARRRVAFDLPGSLLLSGGLVCLLLFLTEASGWGWFSARSGAVFGAAVGLLVVWAWVETRTADPLVDVRTFRRGPLLWTNVATLAAGFAMFGAFSLVPTLIQTPRNLSGPAARYADYGLNATPILVGLYLLPSSVAMLVVAPLAGRWGPGIGFKWLVALGMSAMAVSLTLVAAWHRSGAATVGAMALFGVGLALAFCALPALVIESVDRTVTAAATGVNFVVRTVGAVVGGQVGAAILATTAGPEGIPTERGYVIALVATAAVSLAGVPVAALIRSR